ncbi:MAG TPA: FAD-dependent oxidoreductase [Aeromonadales bacterium]|nr:FAD-dependent oxidoreductase [Aeromonadales bacterium]
MKSILDSLKDANPRPLWHDADIMPEPLPPLSQDTHCELLIVGGGFTGLWAALQAKERRPEVDILLIEQTFIGDGASGRCGGFLNTSLAHGETNTEYQFPGEADKIEALGVQNMLEFIQTLERYQIDARYEQVGAMEVALDKDAKQRLYQLYKSCKRDGDDVVWFDTNAVREQVNSPAFYAGLWYRDGLDGVIDPARLCWGLKETLIKLGVRIYESTKLQSLQSLNKKSMKAVCGQAEIHADKVLLATNAFPAVLGKIKRSIIPVWDYQIATEPLTEEQLNAIGWHKTRHALSDFNNMFHYFRLTKDNRITWGGGGAVRYYFNNGTDKKYEHAPERYEQLAEEFFHTFPQLKGIRFSNKWGGIIATSSRFCMVPGTAYGGRVAWAVGYTGHGVGASRFGARIAIELLGYQPSDILKMQFVRKKAMPWAPEPLRWIGVKLTQSALVKADKNGGKRGLWLKLLDKMNLGFTC